MKSDADLDVGLTTGALRAILAGPASTAGRVDDLARRLGDAIRVGLILDGERLPSEARLARQLGIASVTLREVLGVLRSEGLIATRRGHNGGTVVTAPSDKAWALAQRLDRLTMLELRDLGDQRLAILCGSAELAAARAIPADVDRLRAHVARLSAGRDASELRRADSLFTVEVAVAAQSPRLAQEDLRLRAEVGDLWWIDASDAEREFAVRVRSDMVDSIAAGDATAARRHARVIVDHDTRRLADRRARSARSTRSDATGAATAETRLASEFEAIFASLTDLAAGFEVMAQAGLGEGTLRRRDMAELRPAIERVLEKHSDSLVGAGVVVEPGLLSDVERWLEWLWRAGDGRPEVLRINLDPRAPDFYDYAVTDWFLQPRQSGHTAVAGPYVDAACTGQYTVTLSMPVTAGGRFVGVVAADAPVSVLERILTGAPDSPSGRPWVVVTSDQRVLVSSDSAHLPGELLRTEPVETDVIRFDHPSDMATNPDR